MALAEEASKVDCEVLLTSHLLGMWRIDEVSD